ncbi:MAG: hypothetical protein ACOVQT_07655 [Rubrivivax sp.]|jgi:hypothetical protein|nr:hypothetical protein [Rubrivivax sp.]
MCRPFIISVFVLCIAGLPGHLQAQIVRNPDLLVADAASPVPDGWRVDGQFERMTLDATVQAAGRPTLRIDYLASAPYAGLVQRLDAVALSGQRLVVQGRLARDNGAAAVGVWIRAFNAQRQSIAYANSYEQPLPADRSLREHALEFAVPPEAAFLLVGASVYGADGSAWFGGIDVRLQVQGASPNRP